MWIQPLKSDAHFSQSSDLFDDQAIARMINQDDLTYFVGWFAPEQFQLPIMQARRHAVTAHMSNRETEQGFRLSLSGRDRPHPDSADTGMARGTCRRLL